MKLHGYFRSSASYRVRIALSLKGLTHENVAHHLRRGEQHHAKYRELNPQGLVPALEVGNGVLTQSLGICEYLDEIYAEPPLLPADAMSRARVRAFAQIIACDVHPLQNLKVLNRLRALGVSEHQVTAWAADFMSEGLEACAALIEKEPGPFCFGDVATLADICLVPQLMNARRFGVVLKWPRLLEAESVCLALEAFQRACPERQPDAE